MAKVSLEEFAERVRGKGRIGKYDVQLLQGEILEGGVTSRAEADLLIALDREVGSVHFSWSRFFISALTDFAVWGSGTAGYIDGDKAQWLSALAGEGATDRGRRTLVAIAKEAECFDEAFFMHPTAGTSAARHIHTYDAAPELAYAA